MDSPILLVTEDTTLATPLGKSLAPSEFGIITCEPARCVAEAVTVLPTLVLLDLEIRSAPWQAVLRTLLVEPRTRAVPIVALTRTKSLDPALLVIAGVHDVLTLPLDQRSIDTLADLLLTLSFQFGSGVRDEGTAAADRLVLYAERTRLIGTVTRSGATTGSATFVDGALAEARFGALTGRAALAALLAASGDLRFGAADAPATPETVDEDAFEMIDGSAFLGVEAPEEAVAPPGKQPLVLAVDDDADLLSLIEAYLQGQGFTVETASDGEEGYRRVLDLRPDAVVSDLEMPRLDGWGLLRKIRGDHRVADTPLVFLSAADSFLMSIQAASAGAHDYLSKSGARELLPRRLREALAARVDLEDAMVSKRPVRSRVERTGARWTLQRFTEVAPRGSVIIADGLGLYEAGFEAGEIRFAEVKAAGTTLTGERALDAFVGVRAGDLVIGHAFHKPPNLGGVARLLLEEAAVRNNTAESLAVTRALGGREGLDIDPAVYAVYAKFGPVDGRAVAAALAAGRAPFELLVQAGVTRSPVEIEAILRDLARRGVIRISPV